jgi:hypothetical protein
MMCSLAWETDGSGRILAGGGGDEGRLGLHGATALRLMSSEGKELPLCGSSL